MLYEIDDERKVSERKQVDYQKVVELKPDYAPGWYQLGIAMERQHHSKRGAG
jgi:hypothetical protein